MGSLIEELEARESAARARVEAAVGAKGSGRFPVRAPSCSPTRLRAAQAARQWSKVPRARRSSRIGVRCP